MTDAARSPLRLGPVPLEALAAARREHFDRLGHGPELYLELMLPAGTALRLDWRGREVGHALLSADRCLLELELATRAWNDGPDLLRELVRQAGVTQARCLGFDTLLLGLCLELGFTPRVEGWLHRELLDEAGPTLPAGLGFRPARPADGAEILPHRHGVFDDDDQVAAWIDRGWVHVLEGPAGWIGVGLESPVWPHGPERDVGVLVRPEHRRQGHGERILRFVKRRCLDHGLRPTAGCAVENLASRRALGRAGFASRHRLLLLTGPPVAGGAPGPSPRGESPPR